MNRLIEREKERVCAHLIPGQQRDGRAEVDNFDGEPIAVIQQHDVLKLDVSCDNIIKHTRRKRRAAIRLRYA